MEKLKLLHQNKFAFCSLIIIVLMITSAIFAPLIAPNDPDSQSLGLAFLTPCSKFPFGTDEFGRCILSRIIFGARISLLSGIAITLISAVIGVVLGLLAGLNGGVIDSIIMRTVDIFLAFPGLILALTVAGLLDADILSVVIALSLVGWMGYTRVVRALVLSEKEKDYVEAARSLGASKTKIIVKHLLPAVTSQIIVMSSISIGNNILAAAGLSFLGLGVKPPTAEWGNMLFSGKSYIQSSIYPTLFPGAAITVSVLSFNLLGDGLRDATDPRLRNFKKQISIKRLIKRFTVSHKNEVPTPVNYRV